MIIKLILLSLLSAAAVEMSAVYDHGSQSIVIDGLRPGEYEVAIYTGIVQEFRDHPKVIGKLEWIGQELRFKAKYGFSAGLSYTVIATSKNRPEQNLALRSVVTIPKERKAPSTYLKQVYPTTSLLPMNQLKFYLEFSAPMKVGQAFEHINLYRMPEEKWEKEAFLVMPEELWNEERTRLTIFFDPGRIKRGVQPNLQLGLPMVEGRKYKLVVDQNWLDANGVRLLNDFEKEFQVGAVDRKMPVSDQWTILSPEPGTKESLTIDFHESMDYGLLHSSFLVLNSGQNPVSGKITVSQNERQWHFTPQNPWKDETYDLIVNSWLEDLAGNNLRRKFDVDLNDPADTPKDLNEITIPFETQNRNNQ